MNIVNYTKGTVRFFVTDRAPLGITLERAQVLYTTSPVIESDLTFYWRVDADANYKRGSAKAHADAWPAQGLEVDEDTYEAYRALLDAQTDLF